MGSGRTRQYALRYISSNSATLSISVPSWHFAPTAPKHSKQPRPFVIFSMQMTFAPSSAALRLAMSPAIPAPTTPMSQSSVEAMSLATMSRSTKPTGPRGPGQAAFFTGTSAVSHASCRYASTDSATGASSAKAMPVAPSVPSVPAERPAKPIPFRNERRDTSYSPIVPPCSFFFTT